MKTFLHIRSTKFPILPGEEDEMVNEGLYGKALSRYLQERLQELGYDAPFYCCEDWGWWVELKGFPFTFGVCIRSGEKKDGMMDYACADGAVSAKQWSWKKFRFVETTSASEKLMRDLRNIFEQDGEIEIVGEGEEFPF